ncbi:MAG: class I SAM-dependent methyltransferase [Halothece sp.]
MTTTTVKTKPGLASRLVNGVLAIKPLADLAKNRARNMMIERAETIGVPWRENVRQLRSHDWETELSQVEDPNLSYPDYYVCSFHAYEKGNLDWEAALEVESAAYSVHSTIWTGKKAPDAKGDPMLRESYHRVLKEKIATPPKDIVDLGCSVGMSTFALQETYPEATLTGVDLSPYFLAVANYRSRNRNLNVIWKHTAAENTGLPDASYDLVSACLMFHELPQKAAREIFAEARRILRSGGHFTIMDMNPQSEIYAKMPPYILTLLKSTEPYLDQYFTLDIEQALIEAGFESVSITCNSPRHRTVVAKVK